MKDNHQVYFLTGDLGFHVVENIHEDFPTRFINVGVAEQNLIGIAAGLALAGKKVYVYSIIPFITMRCYEQVRDDLCYHNLDVTLIGAGSGLSYGILGSTHFALEDIAILRPLPNLSIFSPADEKEATAGMQELRCYKSPVYIRVGKKNEPVVYQHTNNFKYGKASYLKKGNKIAIITTGTITSEVLIAADKLLKKNGIDSTVIDIHTIKPLDGETIITVAKNHDLIITVEEHGIIGGVGTAIIETLSDSAIFTPIYRIGTTDAFIHEVGTQEYLRKKLGLDGESIYQKIVQRYKDLS